VLLDIGSVLGGIGLAVIGFVVVILVCVVILRLLAAILPSYEDRSVPASDEPAHEEPDEGKKSKIDASELPSGDRETVD
jgi:hypothetical protein